MKIQVRLAQGAVSRSLKIAGWQHITDVYLLGLAMARDGQLVTFDQSIPLTAVAGANSAHVRVLGGPS